MSDADVEAVSDLVNGALTRGDQDLAAARIVQLRELLPHAAPDASPRLAVRVWLALLDYMTHEEAEIRNAPDMGALLTPGECGALFTRSPWAAHTVIFEACDFDGNSIFGWPDGEGERRSRVSAPRPETSPAPCRVLHVWCWGRLGVPPQGVRIRVRNSHGIPEFRDAPKGVML